MEIEAKVRRFGGGERQPQRRGPEQTIIAKLAECKDLENRAGGVRHQIQKYEQAILSLVRRLHFIYSSIAKLGDEIAALETDITIAELSSLDVGEDSAF